MPGLSQMGLSAIDPDAEPALVSPSGTLIYCATNPSALSLTLNAPDDTFVSSIPQVDPTTSTNRFSTTARFAQTGSDIMASGGSGGIHQIDLAAPDGAPIVIPSASITVGISAMQVDTSGRIIIAWANGAQRFNPDFTLDTTVSFTGGGGSGVLAIDPTGQYVYAVKMTSGGYDVVRWDIDAGGGAAAPFASRSGLQNRSSEVGLVVHESGDVLVALQEITGALGSYAYTFWIHRYGGTPDDYDISAFVPNMTAGITNPLFSSSSVNDRITSNQMCADGDRVWMIVLFPDQIHVGNNARQVVGIDISSVAAFASSRHDIASTWLVSNSAIFNVHTAPTFPGEGRRTASDAAAGIFSWGPVLP